MGSEAKSQGTRTTIILVVVVAVVAGARGGLALRYIRHNVAFIVDRMDVIMNAFRTRLMAALEAMASGDFELPIPEATTSAGATEFSKDEFGRIRREVEDFRGGLLVCYGVSLQQHGRAPQRTGRRGDEHGRAQWGRRRERCPRTSEETGRAIDEIAQAVTSVAAGAEDQVRTITEAKDLTDEVAAASQISANGAQQTADAAVQARGLAQEGADAVAQATEAMRAVRRLERRGHQRDPLAGRQESEQIGEIVDTITGDRRADQPAGAERRDRGRPRRRAGPRLRGRRRGGPQARRGVRSTPLARSPR